MRKRAKKRSATRDKVMQRVLRYKKVTIRIPKSRCGVSRRYSKKTTDFLGQAGGAAARTAAARTRKTTPSTASIASAIRT